MLMPAFLREQGAAAALNAIECGDDAFFIPVWMRAGIRFAPRFFHATHGEFRVGVLTLPMPREMTEAYLAAVIGKRGDPAFLRYFLWESSDSASDQGSGTVIGEWAEARHSNYGPGPPFTGDLVNDRAAFIERVLMVCR
jgi:hypothetical protein